MRVTKGHRGDGSDLASTLCKYDFICSELSKGEMSKAEKYLFRAVNVWWRCSQYFVIASCGWISRDMVHLFICLL